MRVIERATKTDRKGRFELIGENQQRSRDGAAPGPATRRRRTRPTATSWGQQSRRSARSSSPTARSIGPGQTIHYKGICIRVDPTADNYETLAGRALTVVFADPNGKEIARQAASDATTTARSAAASPPRAIGLMGQMTSASTASRRVRRELQRRGVQAAEVPGRRSTPRRARRKLNDEVTCSGKATRLHRRGDRRGQGALARRPRRCATRRGGYWCYWWLCRPPDRQPGDRPRHDATRRRRHVPGRRSSPSRTCRSAENERAVVPATRSTPT